jgi:hypothetical protein
MSCGSFRTVVNNSSCAIHVNYGTNQLHPSVRREFQSPKGWQCEALMLRSETTMETLVLLVVSPATNERQLLTQC